MRHTALWSCTHIPNIIDLSGNTKKLWSGQASLRRSGRKNQTLLKDEQHGPTNNRGWATMKRRATRTHQKPGGGQLWKDEQHEPTKNRGWATMKRRATWTHQKPGVGNYEKTSNTDPPKTRGGQLWKDEQHVPTKNRRLLSYWCIHV